MDATFDMNQDNKRVTLYFHNVDREEIEKRFPEAEWDRMRKQGCYATRTTMGNIEMVFFSKEEE